MFRARTLRVSAAVVIALPFIALATSLAARRPATANPHGSFKEECGLCHGAKGWKPAQISSRFDHAKHGFPLEGAHAAANCTSCHASLDFSQAKTECRSCHEDPHLGELGIDCARCHGARSFLERGPMVRAHRLTRFPLTGSHATLDCETCHPVTSQGHMRFVGVRAECGACHLQEYQAAPDHVASAFPLQCQSCHSTMTWSGARFDHRSTGFPLTGAHVGVACARCHGDGVYRGKPTDCASCHMDDYNSASPDHRAAGFTTGACATCHSTQSWSGADFNHDQNWFPIHSGAHQGRWSACSDCHTSPTDFGQFTCLSCHPHSDRAETDGHHNEVSGYRYDSPGCYSCHPRGRS